jgi:catechol 2,3-dioxygenase-like lactoylglutathione lyase family enzyme
VAWYTRFLGVEPLVVQKGWDPPYMGETIGYPNCHIEWAYFDLPGGGSLELVRYVEPPTGHVDLETYNVGNGHLCLVVDDIHAEWERLRGWATFQSPAPVEIPAGPNKGGWGGYVRDLDGITIQLIQPAPAAAS